MKDTSSSSRTGIRKAVGG